MHRFTKNFPANLIEGTELIFVCVGFHQLQLNLFNNEEKLNLRVDIFGDSYLESIGEVLEKNSEMATPICKLLGQIVLKSQILSDKCLKLTFETDSMFIFDDSDQFESVVLSFADKTFVV